MKFSSLILLAGLAAASAVAQDFERIAPQLPNAEAAGSAPKQNTPGAGTTQRLTGQDLTLVKDLRAIRFIADARDLQSKKLQQYSGVVVDPKVELLAQSQQFATETSEVFLHKSLTQTKLDALRREVIAHYQKHNRPVVTVSVPPQDVTDGVLQLVVTEARIGEVKVEGNKHFKSQRIAGQVHLRAGDNVRSDQLLADVADLNQNPFRNVDVVFEPGAEPGTTNVILRTIDRRPFRVYAGYDDTGVDPTGNDRWFAGFNWGDAFGTDGVLSYQHTTSSDFDRFSAESLTYTAVLPWHHIATLFGSYGQVKAQSLDQLVDTKGESFQLGLRYTIPLSAQTGRFTHSLVLGFDFKQTNNDLAFGGDAVSSDRINIGQFMAGYNASYRTAKSTTTLGLEGYFNPGNWVGSDSTEDYQKLRADAKSQYAYLRGSLVHTQQLPHDFTATATLMGQVATGNLVPTETFGLGGYGTVRGYDERILNTDNAFVASLEIRTPPLSPLHLAGLSKVSDQLQFLAFVDYGIAGNSKLQPEERHSQQLVSVGPGLRYTVNEWLSFRLDYGFALKRVDAESDDSRIHLSATISY